MTKSEIVRGRPPPVLKLMIREHQRWLDSAGKEGLRLNRIDIDQPQLDDLRRLNLDGLDLSLAVLEGVNLTGSSLRGTWLVKANLRGAIFEEDCDLSGARLDGADLSLSTFIGAKYPGAVFEDAVLDEIDWTVTERSRRVNGYTLSDEAVPQWTEADCILQDQIDLEYWRRKKNLTATIWPDWAGP